MSSPLFTEKSFSTASSSAQYGSMTLRGAVDKTIILFLTLLVPAAWIWNKMGVDPEYAVNNGIQSYMIGGLIIGFIKLARPLVYYAWILWTPNKQKDLLAPMVLWVFSNFSDLHDASL